MGAQVQEIENDMTLSDNASSLTLALLAKQVKFVVSEYLGASSPESSSST